MDPRSLASGSRLGRYIVRERLGRGAVATVYLAEDAESGLLVALKTLHDPSGGQAAQRLKREIALAQRMRHSGVCSVFAIEEQDDLLFLTMEYIPGRTLEAVIETEERLAPPRAARVMRSVCAALGAAHEIDILHRDLKPGNIMLRPDDTPAILDFGYATGPDVARLTRTGVWVGTLQYVAPEILKNQPADQRSDIYALGVTLYRALTGEYPFPGVTYGEIASSVLFRDATVLRHHVPGIDRDLERLTLRAMAREPSERPHHVGELQRELESLNLGEDLSDPGRLLPPQVIVGESSLPPALAAVAVASSSQQEAMLATVLVAEPLGIDGAPLDPVSAAARRWLTVRYDILQPEIEKWQGTPLGGRGDELMVWFANADDAVRAGLGLQRLLEIECATSGQQLEVRFGICTGYATFTRGRLIGETAAAAGRVASAATTGNIVITESARAALSEHLQSLTHRLEPRHPAPVAEVLYRITSETSERTAVRWMPPKTPEVTRPKPEPLPKPVAAEAPPGPTSANGAPPEAPSPPPQDSPRASPPTEPDGSRLDPATLHAEHAELIESLRAARRDRGIVSGDNATLDGLERTAELELSRGAWSAGVECLRLALEEVASVVIDNKFVALKLQRLHMRMREGNIRRDDPALEPLLAEIMTAFKSRAFEDANASLNRAFDALAG